MNRPSAATLAAVAAALLAGAASLLAHSYLKKQAAQTPQPVIVTTAATDISVGTRLSREQLKLANWPKEILPSGSYRDPGILVGRVAVRQMSSGDVITEQKLLPQTGSNGGSVMTYLVPAGHRAVTVAVNEVAGVAGFITPNSRVDVVLTTPKPGSSDKEDNIAKIILQNVSVLATGQITEQKDGKPVLAPTVTLDLVPEDSEKLIVGAKKGSLQLLLRNMVDVSSTDTEGATITKALGVRERSLTVAAHRAKKPPRSQPQKEMAKSTVPALVTVEIIKGGVKSKREFAQE